MWTRGPLVIKGKTKEVYNTKENEGTVVVFSTDNISAGDGKRQDVILGKGAVSNKTTSNVFAFLRRVGVPVAYIDQLGDTEMLCHKCTMLPVEVVTRRLAQGSILKREPHVKELERFDPILFELFLKTKNRDWHGEALPCDDPLMVIGGEEVSLYLPDHPLCEQNPFLMIQVGDVLGKNHGDLLETIEYFSRKTFLILEKAYFESGNFQLVDMKIEFGFLKGGRLAVADVIDAESVRLRRDGKNFDKQPYRDGGLNPDLMPRFHEVLKATENFWKVVIPN